MELGAGHASVKRLLPFVRLRVIERELPKGRAGLAKGRRPAGPRRATVQQLTTKGEVVGGSTFVFKTA